MSTGKNLELALRIKADLEQGRSELQQLEATLGQTGAAAQQTNTQLGGTSAAVAKLASESSAAAAGTKAVGAASGTTASEVRQNATAMRMAGISAGQYQQAMRMLPMQLTDVVTSLASGMPIWMVAIQQGGQVRDSFGGIGNAARAVIGNLNPLAVAVSAVVAGVGGLVLAYLEGSRESERFNQALILTGGYAGKTAGQLAAMARELDALDGVTQSSASEALLQVASSGQFAGEQIRMVATAAEQMRVATGKAVEDTVAEFAKLGKDPVSAILELNDKQHFLTQAQLEAIRTLKDQGREQEAVTEAMRVYAKVIADRTAQIVPNLGLIERKWRDIKNVASEVKDGLLSIGRAPDDTQRITELTQKIAYLKSTLGTGFEPLKDTQGEIARLSAELDALNAKQAKAAAAPANTVDTGAEKERQKAQQEFDRLALSNLDKKAQLEREIAEIQKLGVKAGKDQAEIDKQIAAARARYEESLPKARKAPAVRDDAATRMLQQLREQQAALQGQLGSETRISEAQRQQAQFAQLIADLKGKAILTAEQKSLLANQDAIKAQLAQNVALDEQLRKRQNLAENARANAGLQADYLRAIGRDGDAAMLEIGTRFAQMQKEFQAKGNDAGLALIDKLIPIEQARARLDVLQAEIDKAFGQQDRAEQSINVQVNAGLLTESEGRAKLLDLHRQTASVIEQYLPELQQMAQLPGPMGERAQASLDNVRNKVIELRSASSELELAMKNGLTSGIDTALRGLADGTMNLRDAVVSLVQSVADSMAQLASQQLAESATKGVMSLFGGAGQTGTATATDTASAAASATTTATAITTASTAGATAMGTGISTSGTAAAAAMASSIASAGTMAATAMATAIASAGAANAGANAAATGFAAAFATGGHVTGPGTTTSDSIPAMLSNWEYVTRAAVVQQPGALDFLHSFNARGMSALDDYARRVHHATGGLAGVPAPALPAPSLGSARLAEPAKALAATVTNSQSFYLVDSPERIGSIINSPVGHEAVTVMLSRDPAKFRSILGIN